MEDILRNSHSSKFFKLFSHYVHVALSAAVLKRWNASIGDEQSDDDNKAVDMPMQRVMLRGIPVWPFVTIERQGDTMHLKSQI